MIFKLIQLWRKKRSIYFLFPSYAMFKKFKPAQYLWKQKLSQAQSFVIFTNVYYKEHANLIHVTFFLQNCNEAVFCRILSCNFQSLFSKLRGSFIDQNLGLIRRSLSKVFQIALRGGYILNIS